MKHNVFALDAIERLDRDVAAQSGDFLIGFFGELTFDIAEIGLDVMECVLFIVFFSISS
jgi:hypothetical protein